MNKDLLALVISNLSNLDDLLTCRSVSKEFQECFARVFPFLDELCRLPSRPRFKLRLLRYDPRNLVASFTERAYFICVLSSADATLSISIYVDVERVQASFFRVSAHGFVAVPFDGLRWNRLTQPQPQSDYPFSKEERTLDYWIARRKGVFI